MDLKEKALDVKKLGYKVADERSVDMNKVNKLQGDEYLKLKHYTQTQKTPYHKPGIVTEATYNAYIQYLP